MGEGPASWDALLADYELLRVGFALVRETTAEAREGDVLVVGPARTLGEFESRTTSSLKEGGYEFLGFDWLARLGELDIAIELFALAAAAIERGDVAIGAPSIEVGSDAEQDAEDTAPPVDWDQLRASSTVVEIVTTSDEAHVALIDYTDELVLVQRVDLPALGFGGYAVYPVGEVLDVDPWSERIVEEAIKANGESAMPLGAPLSDLRAFVRWAHETGLLVGLVTNQTATGRRFIGAITEVGYTAFRARGASGDEWEDEETSWEYADVTRIDVLDGYLRAAERALGRGGQPS